MKRTVRMKGFYQCSGSMTFWCGSGSADPCLWLIDPDLDSDPDPAIFVINLQDANKKLIKKSFSPYYFLKVHFFQRKKYKISHKTVKFEVFLIILLDDRRMIYGSGSVSTPLTNGSGSWSGRPKNMWIRWIDLDLEHWFLHFSKRVSRSKGKWRGPSNMKV
jgi:hypothetical protein